MIELHGWITIREAYDEENESDERLVAAISLIDSTLSKMQSINLFAKCIAQNGTHNLVINGNFNHKDSRWDDVMHCIDLVIDVALGSYGVLHYYDDEDKEGCTNTFQMLVIKKGQIEKHIDQNLTPFFSKVEDI